ncbi:MAG: uroporphyrinogen-III C-methyltransferase [Candidatus Mycalebacterium zealandia]|nr:MAG: uroporphyrinogen-III C-methyltransferase [Candidatus Mycalebacterium zealandia]
MKKGKAIKNRPAVYLVGAGPGDPGLITVKGMETLACADVVIYDALANNSLLEFAPHGAEMIFAGKKKGMKTLEQKEINRLMINKAQCGKTVVRLKGGDPFVFGRGGEETEALLSAGIVIEVIPGVSSVYSVPAYSGVPLTHRDFNSSFAVVTGHEKPDKKSRLNWKNLAGMETVVFLMSLNNIEEITKKLIQNKKPRKTPVMVTSRGTTGKQKTVVGTLENISAKIRGEGADFAPAVVIAGGAIGMRKKLNWFETKPLFGKKIVVTRPAGQSADFVKLLQQRGAEVISFPCIEIVPPRSWNNADRIIKNLSSCDFLAFTSVNGVERFFERMKKKALDSRALAGIQTVAIGSKTAEALNGFGIEADIIPKKYTAEGVLAEMKKRGIRGKTFFIPRAEKARDALPAGLKKMGAKVQTAPCYRTRIPKHEPAEIKAVGREMFDGAVDMVVFTSSSSATNFLAIFKNAKEILSKSSIGCIGPITAKTVEDAGFKPSVVAKKHTAEGLADAMSVFFEK